MEPWTFCHVTDIHCGSPRSFRYQPGWVENWKTARAQILECRPELLLCGGDVSRDGHVHRLELEQAKAGFDALPFPVHVVPGNHDIGDKIAPGDSAVKRTQVGSRAVRLWESVFGSPQWSFVHKDVRFSGFNAMLCGSGLPEEEAMWAWLEAQPSQPRARRHVWIMHPALFVHEPGEPNFDPVADGKRWYWVVDRPHRERILRVFKASGATMVISGHLHVHRQVEAEGIAFVLAPATAFRTHIDLPGARPELGFLRCEVDARGVHPHFVPLAAVSELKGYGKGGNPGPEDRDYSLAWEQPALDAEEQKDPAGYVSDSAKR